MCLLVDDIIALDAGCLTSSLSFQDQAKIKALFITHAHYDHIRDIPAFAMNLYLRQRSVNLYTHQAAYENLIRYFLNDVIYPNFHQRPADNPTLKIHILEPYQSLVVEGYKILSAPVNHALPAMGYQVTSPNNKTMFYTGDTGAGLSDIWQTISPDILVIELTAPNKWEESMTRNKHLDARLLEQELRRFREMKGYLPRVIAVHINPADENQIKFESEAIAKSLGIEIELAFEGMQIEV
jgi:ribonuclease BN (tRNA processing enzyme)